MEQAKKRNHKIYVTDTAIDKVGSVKLSDFTGDQIQRMRKNPFAVSVIINAERQSLVYLHNHPSTNIFSVGDIDTFICEGSIKTMSVVTNQGEVHVLNKTEKYEYNKARMLMAKTYEYFSGCPTIDNNDFVKRFLKKCNEGGIEYAKPK